ncbi:ATP-dependent zinc metalloprotease FtsH [Angelakisella massiliensis]|uniref:ATP-dependent zinc metalloprotease FtsH n=1 Tax=Angelakisella massiliensis TaxID=1871018 RepID=UPI0023A8636D|nr:ATP-dependent zinc metalloprotease FtsH [Angelakisella massiliensis]
MGGNSKKSLFIYLAIIVVLMIVATQVYSVSNTPETTPYNEILSYFQNDQVKEYTLDYGTGELTIKLRDNNKEIYYMVPNLTVFYNDTHEMVKEYNETHPDSPIVQNYIAPKATPWWVTLLPTLLLIGVMTVFWFVIMRQARGGGNPMSFAKAKPRMQDDKDRVTFADVAGADEEKQELQEIVEFLKNPQKYNTLGARIPKGVLLMGPPGTGKTLLAKAVAGEAGVPFFSISGSDFVEMFVGVGASRVRDLFEQAKKNAPSIVFIDEIDAVGRHRGAGLGGGHDEREQTLNQLLVEMDGFGANSGVIVIAATNRKDILDPALMRPGRFDRHVTVGYPDVKGREAILKVHTRNKPVGPDVDLKVIAQTTGGFTGADLENLVNEAALLAARKDKRAITMEEIQEATIKVIVGPEKRSHVILEKERRLTAYHEAGHAIVTYHFPNQDKVHEVSIIPRGGAGGYTLSLPEKDVMYKTRNEMKEDICILLGGRVAEQLVLEDISTGASNDIERATKIARAMVTRYGFSEKLGTMVYGKDQNEVFLGMDLAQDRGYSEQVAAMIDEEIRSLIDTAYDQATEILKSDMDKLHELAEYLKKNEKIDGETFEKLMKGELSPKQPEEAQNEETTGAQEEAAPDQDQQNNQ